LYIDIYIALLTVSQTKVLQCFSAPGKMSDLRQERNKERGAERIEK